MTERVLVIEADPDAILPVETCLSGAGYGVSFVREGSHAVTEARRQRPDIILMELGLSDIDGFELVRLLRDDPTCRSVPIIVVTQRSSIADRIAVLEAGADDVVSKPFSARELVLRVGARLRMASHVSTQRRNVLRVGGLEIDVVRHRVCVEGKQVQLSPTEFRLALYLATEPGHVRSRPELLEHVWDLDPSTGTRTIDTHVKRLRDKLGPMGDCIETVPRVGYRLREPRSQR